MLKMVTYVGNNNSVSSKENTNLLEIGKNYMVTEEVTSASKVEYKLKGIEGSFDSALFELPYVLLGISDCIPKAGLRLENLSILSNRGTFEKVYKTSVVKEVIQISNNVYYAYCKNMLYIVSVLNADENADE